MLCTAVAILLSGVNTEGEIKVCDSMPPNYRGLGVCTLSEVFEMYDPKTSSQYYARALHCIASHLHWRSPQCNETHKDRLRSYPYIPLRCVLASSNEKSQYFQVMQAQRNPTHVPLCLIVNQP